MTKKKSFLSLFVAVFFLVSCMFLMTACGEEEGEGGNGGTGGGTGIGSVAQTSTDIKAKLGTNYKVVIHAYSDFGEVLDENIVIAEADNYFYYQNESSKTLINTQTFECYNYDDVSASYEKNVYGSNETGLSILRDSAYGYFKLSEIAELGAFTPVITHETKLTNRNVTAYQYNIEGSTIKIYIDDILNVCVANTTTYGVNRSEVEITELKLSGVSLQEEIALIVE